MKYGTYICKTNLEKTWKYGVDVICLNVDVKTCDAVSRKTETSIKILHDYFHLLTRTIYLLFLILRVFGMCYQTMKIRLIKEFIGVQLQSIRVTITQHDSKYQHQPRRKCKYFGKFQNVFMCCVKSLVASLLLNSSLIH